MILVKQDLKTFDILTLIIQMSDKDFNDKVNAFEPDVVISENVLENVVTIDKALSNLCAIGLYKPSLDEINTFDIKNKPIPKIIYLDDLLYKKVFEEYGEVTSYEIDYFNKAINLVYNIVG